MVVGLQSRLNQVKKSDDDFYLFVYLKDFYFKYKFK
jgi:hypothetical protein